MTLIESHVDTLFQSTVHNNKKRKKYKKITNHIKFSKFYFNSNVKLNKKVKYNKLN